MRPSRSPRVWCCRRPTVRPMCEHVFVRWENLTVEQQREADAARLPRTGGRSHLRRARGARTSASTRSAPSRPSTRCPKRRGCRSGGRSTRTGMHPCVRLLRGGRHAHPHGRWARPSRSRMCGRRRDLRHGPTGSYRRYVMTEVLAHWSTVKPAYASRSRTARSSSRAATIASSANRGWKHVTGRVNSGRWPPAASDAQQQADGHWAHSPRRPPTRPTTAADTSAE